ncbi:MAG: hypothetical protein HY774_01390 [Acidobacteria bacterium]|nr:hypothetical protein [Acidobacteriota bacterium]
MKKGIAIGLITTGIIIFLILLPGFLTRSTSRNEFEASMALIEIFRAEMAFKAYCGGKYTTLDQLIKTGLVRACRRTDLWKEKKTGIRDLKKKDGIGFPKEI